VRGSPPRFSSSQRISSAGRRTARGRKARHRWESHRIPAALASQGQGNNACGGNAGKSEEVPCPVSVSRCCASEIAAALERLSAGEAFLADRPWRQIWWGVMRLDLVSGWGLAIWIERDQLGACHSATAPDGRTWIYGCQRDDWTLGPQARVLDPVAQLPAASRRALEQRLRTACCWPAPLRQGPAALLSLAQLQRISGRTKGAPRQSLGSTKSEKATRIAKPQQGL
jgi:hypothetical protein